jgi:hypothetical protein
MQENAAEWDDDWDKFQDEGYHMCLVANRIYVIRTIVMTLAIIFVIWLFSPCAAYSSAV